MTIIESPQASYQLVSVSYTVPSASEAGKTYTVTVTDNRYSCSCKAEQFPKTRGRCWHIKSVIAGAITSKLRVCIRPLEATVAPTLVGTFTERPSGNPYAVLLYDAD